MWQYHFANHAKKAQKTRDWNLTPCIHDAGRRKWQPTRVLAWKIPGMASHRVGHDWSDLTVAVAYMMQRPGFPAVLHFGLILIRSSVSFFLWFCATFAHLDKSLPNMKADMRCRKTFQSSDLQKLHVSCYSCFKESCSKFQVF